MSGKIVGLLVSAIDVYRQVVSPLIGPRCRFAPSCSAYAAQALRAHGLWRGLFLTFGRLARCQPFNRGGHDPVPTRRSPSGTLPSRRPTHPGRPSTLSNRRAPALDPSPAGVTPC